MTWMLALKILFCVWVAVFAWFFIKTFIHKDEKFGQYDWKTSLLCAIFFSTVAPPWVAYDCCKNPKKAYKRWVLAKFD
jgi:hypothetical protein